MTIDPHDLSLKVNIWEIMTYEGARGNTYRVRWKVGTERFKEPFKNRAQADVFRGQLLQAQSRGESFSLSKGLPVSMLQPEEPEQPDESWFDFACRYIDDKWDDISAKHRGNIAFALMMATRALLTSEKGKPDDFLLRAALRKWAFSKTKRESGNMPEDVEVALDWVSRNTRQVSELADSKLAEVVVKAATTTLDGKKVSVDSRQRNHSILKAAMQFAVDEGLLEENPIKPLKLKGSSRVIHQVDSRCVVNPTQAKALLEAVRRYGYEDKGKWQGQQSGPRMVAFFGSMYYAALRPEEAVNLHKHNLSLPKPKRVVDEDGNESLVYDWGWIYLDEVTPDARPEFTDNGTSRDTRDQLKQREPGVMRQVPSPPELTQLLWEHLEQFGTDPQGRFFTGIMGKPLATITYRRAWAWAREQALTEAEQASPLAETPYSLRHTGVSTWLNAGVSETQVAEWAGHSVAVLKRIYAKCIVGEAKRDMEKISAAYRRG
ncbi:site-specific integrase [Nocardiopsis rhodophaea]|uniref:tyrosine-type recombinase/integrase n=1 Tax=Nocardiopsis rhodophaea TaxID=280238 RepID=UPI0031DFE11A